MANNNSMLSHEPLRVTQQQLLVLANMEMKQSLNIKQNLNLLPTKLCSVLSVGPLYKVIAVSIVPPRTQN